MGNCWREENMDFLDKYQDLLFSKQDSESEICENGQEDFYIVEVKNV